MPIFEGIMEDPVVGILKELMATVTRSYIVSRVEYSRDEDVFFVSFTLRPVKKDATISLWRLLDLENKIMRKLSFRALLSHTRIGLGPDGESIIVSYTFRKVSYE